MLRPTLPSGTLLALGLALLPTGLAAQSRATRQPTLPPPSITEYHPRSTLVVPRHPVPRAKFPAVDFHGHPPRLNNRETIERVLAAMDSLNLGVMIQAMPSSGDRLKEQIATVEKAGYADRFVFFANLELQGVGPGSGAEIAAQLEEDV
ncbi:MAG TPA: hypothetical protein VJ997_08055, partial [Longimicrobiales bacterium]|nr:hypothetical protein [Longimicrobiales bacterium]